MVFINFFFSGKFTQTAVHSPLFFRRIVEIEHLPLQADVFVSNVPGPASLDCNSRGHLLSTFETNVAARNGNISALYRRSIGKTRDSEKSKIFVIPSIHTHKAYMFHYSNSKISVILIFYYFSSAPDTRIPLLPPPLTYSNIALQVLLTSLFQFL